MGTFAGHIVPGFSLTLLGLWHIFNTIKAYNLKDPNDFRSRFWYPFKTPFSKLKHLELLFILSFSIFAILMQVLDFPLLQLSFKLDNFEHATMFLHLAIYAGTALAVEFTHSPEFFSGLIGIMATSVFGQELFLLHFHSADHIGLEGQYHWLLQVIVIVSFLAGVAVMSFPASFVAALVLSIMVVFQGCWFINMGFMLWVPRFIPKGCSGRVVEDGDYMHGAVECGTIEASLRAKALANLQFSWILAGILIVTACIFLKLAKKYMEKRRSTEYEQLYGRGEDVGQISMDMDGSKKAQP